MTDYKEMILKCEVEVNKLHKNLRETFKHREKSPRQREQWKRAAKDFRGYPSPVYDLVEQCLKFGLLHDQKLREFTFDYIDIDPYFFRSGYMLDSLLQRVKKLHLTGLEITLIQRLILRRIETGALRNFRRICRLIHMLDIDGFYSEVSNRAKSTDSEVRRRAKFALAYFPIDGRLRGDGFIIK